MGSLSLDISRKEAYGEAFNHLLTCPVSEIPSLDIALMNLLCAQGLPGSGGMDIPHCLERLNDLVEFCIKGLEKFVWHPAAKFSKAYHRMSSLITVMKRDYGAHYEKEQERQVLTHKLRPRTDSRDIFINGLLSPTKSGTCSSLPVLVAAVARRLGHPVYIIQTGMHMLNRWQSPDEKFNIEPSGLMGMTSESDEDYREKDKAFVRMSFPLYLNDLQLDSDFWYRPLTPAQELALFLELRVECLLSNNRFMETLPLMARSLQLESHDPIRPIHFMEQLGSAMRSQYRKLHPKAPLSKLWTSDGGNLALMEDETIPKHQIPLSSTIMGHFHERRGQIRDARRCFTRAWQYSDQNPVYKENLDRFVKKHLLRNGGRKVKFNPTPPPEKENALLREVAIRYEADQLWVCARDAWSEAYLADENDLHAFQQLQKIETKPEYKKQLREQESAKQVDWMLEQPRPMIYSGVDAIRRFGAHRTEWGLPSFSGLTEPSRDTQQSRR